MWFLKKYTNFASWSITDLAVCGPTDTGDGSQSMMGSVVRHSQAFLPREGDPPEPCTQEIEDSFLAPAVGKYEEQSDD
jgi:hypothetical protein